MNDLMHDAMERALWDAHGPAAPEEAFKLGWDAALERAWEAVHAERLIDPTEEHGDLVYQRAVEDCENAVFALKEVKT
jgi:hypothetical protein